MKLRLIGNWRSVVKSYSFLSLLAIILSTLSWGGLVVLGVMSSLMSFWCLLGTAIFFAVIGMAGRFIQQDLEDGKPFWEEKDE